MVIKQLPSSRKTITFDTKRRYVQIFQQISKDRCLAKLKSSIDESESYWCLMSPTGQIFEIDEKLKKLLEARNDWKQLKVQKIQRDQSKVVKSEENVHESFKSDQKEESSARKQDESPIKETMIVLTTIDSFKQLKKERTFFTVSKSREDLKLKEKVGEGIKMNLEQKMQEKLVLPQVDIGVAVMDEDCRFVKDS